MNLENITSWIMPFSLIFIAIVYTFSQLRAKNDESNKNLIINLEKERDLYKERAERMEKEGRDREAAHQRQMNDLNKEIGILKGSLDQMAKQNEMYLAILKDKNPEQIEFMKLLSDSAKESARLQKNAEAFMARSEERQIRSDALDEQILKFMKSLDAKAEEVKKRNYAVDNGPTHTRDISIKNIEKIVNTSQTRDEAIDRKAVK